jgi:hypothetical protein
MSGNLDLHSSGDRTSQNSIMQRLFIIQRPG